MDIALVPGLPFIEEADTRSNLAVHPVRPKISLGFCGNTLSPLS